jgi:hypothetical protein
MVTVEIEGTQTGLLIVQANIYIPPPPAGVKVEVLLAGLLN